MSKDKAQQYKEVAMKLLEDYLDSEQSVISEYSGDFEKSAMILRKQVLKYLKGLDEGEDTFNELVKDMWISQYYETEEWWISQYYDYETESEE